MQPVRPKKNLGQHFLRDDNIARKIVSSISPNIKYWLEIGPGTGVLTKQLLLNDFIEIKLVEIDTESVTFLNENFTSLEGRIFETDFLKMNISNIFPDKFGIIGNFPYNISSQILFKMLENKTIVVELIGMFQKEVALRIASKHGTKEYGILSVLVQAFYDVEYLFTVNEQVFVPPPKVKSAVIRLKRREIKELACDEKLFFIVVKTGFNQRRKTLRNALKSIVEFPLTNDIFSKRAEQLSVADFVFLTQHIQALKENIEIIT